MNASNPPQVRVHPLRRCVKRFDLAGLAWLVLAVCMASTMAAWYFTSRDADAKAELHLKIEANSARTAIERRMEGYLNVLRGGAALFNAVGNVSREQWHTYVSGLQIETYWPGIQGIGYAEMLASEKKAAHTAKFHAQGFPDYGIKPAGVREVYSTVIYLEPFSGGNLEAFGYDMFSEPTRRAAMELARDTGRPAYSDWVRLIMDTTSNAMEGFLIYVPVYTPDMPIETMAQRRIALRGFVYGLFRMSDLMRGVLGEANKNFDMRISDGVSDIAFDARQTPSFDANGISNGLPPRYKVLWNINLPGRTWDLELQSRPELESAIMGNLPIAVAVGGVLLDLLLFFLVIALLANKRSSALLRKLSLALEQSPESVIITDVDGRIEYVNDAFLVATDYSREEIIGQNPRILQSGKTPPINYSAMWDALKRGLPWQGEFYNRRKDGSEYVEFAIVTPLRQPDGQISHYVAVKENITEKKRMSEELDYYRLNLEELVVQRTTELIAERQKADVANEAKSTFIASMSHEIRTPLNAVLGFAHLCLNLNLAARERDYVNKIRIAAESLLGIVNDILDFSKIKAGKLEMESIPFGLSEALFDVANLFNLQARNKGIELVIGAMPDVPDSLVGDPLRLGQVLINLMSNSLKFTDHGEISLTVERASQTAGIAMLRFTVRDTGIGMTQEQQTKLFSAFSQADSSTTRKYGGTGLGLALSQQLVNAMGGEIHVKSEMGAGSSFEFTAPFGVSAAKAAYPSLAGKKVLIVDNNAAMLLLTSCQVKAFGCQIESLDSGQAALDKIHAGVSYDLILMDWHMPDLDGLGTAHAIRAGGSTAAILLITGDDTELARARACALGVDIQAFLCKPVSIASLHDALVNALGSPLALSSSRPDKGNPAKKPMLTGRHILLVEDNDFNRQISRELVELAGARVTTANDGAQAVAAVNQASYDLVLMDIQMPVMDGYRATSLIRERWPNLPIIALTAHALREEQSRVLAAGMNDILTKPILPDTLYAILDHWLKNGTQQTAGRPEPESPPSSPQRSTAPAARLLVFDHATALSRVNGNPKTLDRFLRMFRERNAHIVEEIGAALRLQDLLLARQLAHSLKGGSGTMGLLELEVAAAQMENALADALALKSAEPPTHRFEEFPLLEAAWQRAQETLDRQIQAMSSGASS